MLLLHSLVQRQVLQLVLHPRPHPHQLVAMQQQPAADPAPDGKGPISWESVPSPATPEYDSRHACPSSAVALRWPGCGLRLRSTTHAPAAPAVAQTTASCPPLPCLPAPACPTPRRNVLLPLSAHDSASVPAPPRSKCPESPLAAGRDKNHILQSA